MSRRVVGPLPLSAEGSLERGGVSPRAEALRGGLAEGASNEAETTCASRGLGREPSSGAEIVPRLARPRRDRTVVLGRGPGVHLGFPRPKRYWAPSLDVGAASWKDSAQVANLVLRALRVF